MRDIIKNIIKYLLLGGIITIAQSCSNKLPSIYISKVDNRISSSYTKEFEKGVYPQKYSIAFYNKNGYPTEIINLNNRKSFENKVLFEYRNGRLITQTIVDYKGDIEQRYRFKKKWR